MNRKDQNSFSLIAAFSAVLLVIPFWVKQAADISASESSTKVSNAMSSISAQIADFARPLWLIHRSLLI